MNRTHWPAKDPAETLVATFDYSAELDAGETIDVAETACTLLSGTDADPAEVLDSAPTIDAGTVLQRLTGGVDGATYTLRCQATLDPTGRILVLAATLPVRTA